MFRLQAKLEIVDAKTGELVNIHGMSLSDIHKHRSDDFPLNTCTILSEGHSVQFLLDQLNAVFQTIKASEIVLNISNKASEVVVTRVEDTVVAVTRQDKNHRILNTIWEKK